MKLRIEKAIYGGAGLAHISADESAQTGPGSAGKTVFVPYALPGELVEAHMTGNQRGFSTAELDSVLEPAAERVDPGCEYFPACGGCQYQHASARYQLQMKLDILKETLQRAHLASIGSIGCLGAQPWAYRNRIRLHVAGAKGRGEPGLSLCYRERGSHRNLPVTHCPIAAPLLDRAITAVLRIGDETGLANLCEEIEFFTNSEQDKLLVSLWTAGSLRPPAHRVSPDLLASFLEKFCTRLRNEIPELAGAGLFSLESQPGGLLGHWGERSVLYAVAGRGYRVSLGSFFQVNRFLIPELVELVTGDRSGQAAWDLYAGVGLFTLALGFEHVTAVESNPFSAADLKRNLAGTLHAALQSTTLDFLRGASRREAKPDLILLDPPRGGLGKEVCGHLARVAAPEIIYISCDPATLARDLQALLHSGYCLRKMDMVDLFPQTFHLETIAVLRRN